MSNNTESERVLTSEEYKRLSFMEQLQYIESHSRSYSWNCPFCCFEIFWCTGKPPSQQMIDHIRTHPQARGVYPEYET